MPVKLARSLALASGTFPSSSPAYRLALQRQADHHQPVGYGIQSRTHLSLLSLSQKVMSLFNLPLSCFAHLPIHCCRYVR
jgi:hypothetical protein